MASLAQIESEIRGLPKEQQASMRRIFTAILRDWRFGHPTGTPPDPSVNFGGGFYSATTDATANTEFSIAHGFGRVPYLIVPVLPLDQVNAQIVPLKVTRAADDKRVYLSSSSESADFFVYLEG